ncbi:hypothetical protein GCM10008905_28250 [Clostridium malenominatum]|uniref:Uncharacterized protein n=1 Tax=Clostridium malenominatum TaxID=1539 RepID=A0ABN1J4Z3_9CLOT
MAFKENIRENLTSGFSKIVKTVGEGAATVAKKSGEIVEISKLNLSVSTEKNNIEKLYREIGEMVFEKYANGEAVDLDLEKPCKEIENSNNNIKEIKEKIEDIKNNKEYEDSEEEYGEENDEEDDCCCCEDEIVANCEGNICNFEEPKIEEDIIK